jgi:pimeloyl-ACP methyl ester carboxylesterase
MTLPGMPEPKRVECNGVNLAVYERGDGFPVVFSHGFPELAFSWRHQLRALSDAGFRAIAPDQRGYGLSDRPPELEDYDIFHLTGDLVGLLDALDIEKAVFAGHDWGGLVVWQLPLLHPDRVAGVIGVNTPYLPRGPMSPLAMMKSMMGENHYIVHFQKRGEADAAFAADPERVFRKLFRKGIELSEVDFSQPMKNMVEIVQDDEERGVPALSDEEIAVYAEAFTRTGFTGAINWYRNIERNWERSADLPKEIDVPCLMICAENDFALPPFLAQGMDTWIADLETHTIAGCGHWTQVEKTDELNALLVDWLRRRF